MRVPAAAWKGAATCPSDAMLISEGLCVRSSILPEPTDKKNIFTAPSFVQPTQPPRSAILLPHPFPRAPRCRPLHRPSKRQDIEAGDIALLTATQNIVGRVANGVHCSHVCPQPARVREVDETWLYAESSRAIRDGRASGAWVDAVKAAVCVLYVLSGCISVCIAYGESTCYKPDFVAIVVFEPE